MRWAVPLDESDLRQLLLAEHLGGRKARGLLTLPIASTT